MVWLQDLTLRRSGVCGGVVGAGIGGDVNGVVGSVVIGLVLHVIKCLELFGDLKS